MKTNQNIMKNLKKLNKSDLKSINGGRPAIGCRDWDNRSACCREWANGYCGNTCPNSPPPLC